MSAPIAKPWPGAMGDICSPMCYIRIQLPALAQTFSVRGHFGPCRLISGIKRWLIRWIIVAKHSQNKIRDVECGRFEQHIIIRRNVRPLASSAGCTPPRLRAHSLGSVSPACPATRVEATWQAGALHHPSQFRRFASPSRAHARSYKRPSLQIYERSQNLTRVRVRMRKSPGE